jgi:carbon-monoxide dehydrogenase small subunit
MTKTAFWLNGAPVEAEVEARTSLADFLRGQQHLTATHLGCEHGACGACTLLIDGAPARSCIVFTASLQGARVQTLEGLQEDPLMTEVREAFHAEHALQCGFCTPGMLVTVRDIASRFETIDEKRIRTELSGNLCRCTGYVGIVNAAQRVIREVPVELRMRKPATPPDEPVPVAAPDHAFPPAPKPASSLAAPVPVAAARTVAPHKGWSRVEDAFSIARAPDEVWRLFGDTARMAACLPAFQLEREEEGTIHGRMQVGFGPITAGFACAASHERDDAQHAGLIRGSGQDSRGGSRAKGQIGYRVASDPAAVGSTRVDITLEFQIQGPLAQFSRSGLVRSFASKMIAAFAQNLSASLGGGKPAGAGPSASLGSTWWSMVRERIKRLFGRGKKNGEPIDER